MHRIIIFETTVKML